MPTLAVEITERHLTKLQRVVNVYNANNGTALTVEEWHLLHLKDVAITEELTPRLQAIQQQADRDAQALLQAAITAERERLLADL